jgi:hypothetical protein
MSDGIVMRGDDKERSGGGLAFSGRIALHVRRGRTHVNFRFDFIKVVLEIGRFLNQPSS